jgi:hypothetical protein
MPSGNRSSRNLKPARKKYVRLRNGYVGSLLFFTLLFALYAFGQAIAFNWEAGFLPSMWEWSSSPVRYSAQLQAHFIILGLMVRIFRDVATKKGFFSLAPIWVGENLRWLSYLYCLSIVARFVFTLVSPSEKSWFEHLLPISFHVILAGYTYTYCHYLVVFSHNKYEES